MTYVRFERRGAAAWATLARPDRANALGPEIVWALAEWIRAAGEDASISALVITGEGAAFCPGADVKASLKMAHEPDQRAAFFDEARDMLGRLSSAPVPVIAAVNGVAYAGGLELALACDFIIATQSARFGDLHLPHGRIPAWGSSARLLNALGPWRSSRMLLHPSPVSAEELRELGVVALVVDDANLVQAVDEVVSLLAGYQPEALRAMKALIAEQRGHALKPLLDTSRQHISAGSSLAGTWTPSDINWLARAETGVDEARLSAYCDMHIPTGRYELPLSRTSAVSLKEASPWIVAS